MGLTTRQLQDLRLRGVGPQIVQRGLSVHYELADILEIERHEAVAVLDQVLASEQPLNLLRALVDLAGFKPSPILQHVSKGATPATPAQQRTPVVPAASSAALLNVTYSAVGTNAAAMLPLGFALVITPELASLFNRPHSSRPAGCWGCPVGPRR